MPSPCHLQQWHPGQRVAMRVLCLWGPLRRKGPRAGKRKVARPSLHARPGWLQLRQWLDGEVRPWAHPHAVGAQGNSASGSEAAATEEREQEPGAHKGNSKGKRERSEEKPFQHKRQGPSFLTTSQASSPDPTLGAIGCQWKWGPCGVPRKAFLGTHKENKVWCSGLLG